jgi:hypothetical protein
VSEDGKDLEEEGATKIVPKWKASHITEIMMEPEPEEEDLASGDAPKDAGEEGQEPAAPAEGEDGAGDSTQEEGVYTLSVAVCELRLS